MPPFLLALVLVEYPFYFYKIDGNVSTFIADFSNLNLLLFWVNLDKGLSILLIFQKIAFSFIALLFSILFISVLLLSSASFGFSLLFFF